MTKKVVLAGACRTAIGKMGGALSNTPAAELGSIVIKEALTVQVLNLNKLTIALSKLLKDKTLLVKLVSKLVYQLKFLP